MAFACECTRPPRTQAMAPAPDASTLAVSTSAATIARSNPRPSHPRELLGQQPFQDATHGSDPDDARAGEESLPLSVEDLSAWYAAHSITEAAPHCNLASQSQTQPMPSTWFPRDAVHHSQPESPRLLPGSEASPARVPGPHGSFSSLSEPSRGVPRAAAPRYQAPGLQNGQGEGLSEAPGIRNGQAGGLTEPEGNQGAPANGFADLYPCTPSWGAEVAWEGTDLAPGGWDRALGGGAGAPQWEELQSLKLNSHGPLRGRRQDHTREGRRRAPGLQTVQDNSVEILVLDSWEPAEGFWQQRQGAPLAAASLKPPRAGGVVPGTPLAVYPGSHYSGPGGNRKKRELKGIPEQGLTGPATSVPSPTKSTEPRSALGAPRPTASRRMLVKAHSDRPQRSHGPSFMGFSPRRKLAKAQSEKECKPRSILVVDKQEYLARTSPLDRKVTFRDHVDLFVFP